MGKIKNTLSDIDPDIIICDAVIQTNKKGTTIKRISIKTKERSRACPHCSSEDCNINDSGKKRTVKHTPQSRVATVISFIQRRFLCKHCKVTFMEQLDWLHPDLGITWDLFHAIEDDLKHKLSKKEIARINGVSEYYVSAVAKLLKPARPDHLPEVVCLDETAGDAEDQSPNTSVAPKVKYVTNFSDGRTGEVLDILPFKTTKKLAKYFNDNFTLEERSKVRFLCCDMGKAYLNLAKHCFPNAVVCLDNFHVTNRLNEAMDAARIKEQDRLLSDGKKAEYDDLKRLNKRFKTALDNQPAKWGIRGKDISTRVLTALGRSPELQDTYAMLQYFHEIMHDCCDFDSKSTQLDLWIRTFETSRSDIICGAVKAVKDHLAYIHNAWRHGLSNATSEGNNRVIKAIKNFSFGVHSFDYLRTRVLLICGRPGVDRGRKKKEKDTSTRIGLFFFDAFPSLEEYQPVYDWNTHPAAISG